MSKKFYFYLAWGLLIVSSAYVLLIPSFYRHLTFALIPLVSILSIEHSKNNFRPSILLILIASIIGLSAEIYGLNYGTIFGARYEYSFVSWPSFMGVPFQVGAFWAIFYYLSHTVVNIFNRSQDLFKSILLDGAIMTGIDLLLDPVMVDKGVWRWFGTGPYFGIPTGNFIGWFLVSLVISVVIRLILKIRLVDKSNYSVAALASVVVLLLVVSLSP